MKIDVVLLTAFQIERDAIVKYLDQPQQRSHSGLLYHSGKLGPYCVVVITGDRFWGCPDLAEQVLNRLLARYGPDLVIIHGGANGVDQAFHVAARELGIDVEPHLADWKGLANIAGTARNREMVEAGADLCLALHRSLETSKGTKDCVRQALAAGIPVYLIEDERAVPRRVLAVDTGTV